MKKTLAWVMALALLFTLSGMAEPAREKVGNVYVDGNYPICDETIELSVAVGINATDFYGETHEKKAWVVDMEKELNVKINWITLLDGVNERKAVMLASGDMPDVFGGGWLNDSDIINNSQLFVQLDELLPKYGKRIVENLETVTGGDWVNCMTYPDGHIYSIMGGNYKAAKVTLSTPFWRQSWLDEVGMEVPTTTDEVYDVLKAFKDAKLGGEKTIPMEFCEANWASSLSYFFGVYGITCGNGSINGQYYTLRDGEVIGWANSQNLRDCLDYLSMLVKDGLLNPEGLTETSEQFMSNLSSGICGSGILFGTEITDEALAMDYVFTPGKITAPGYEDEFLLSTNEGASYVRNCWTITTACEEPIAALLVWDYLSQSQDFAYSVRYGSSGLIWENIDGRYTEVNRYVDESFTVDNLKAFYSQEEYPWIYEDSSDVVAIVSSQIFQHPPLLTSMLFQLEPVNVTTNRRLYTLYYYNGTGMCQEEAMSTAIITSEQKEALDLATDGLKNYISTFIAKGILDGVTDEAWDAYVSELDDYGYDYYIDWYQNYKDGTLDEFI